MEEVFQSGKRLNSAGFYTASSVDFDDEIIVTPSAIEVTQKQAASR